MREALPPRLAPALIGHVDEGPLAGRTVYEALHDPRPAELLLEALRSQARIGGLRFERDPRQEIRAGLVPRVMTAEQSNSSVVYGDTFILKLLRRIVPGVNPDLELPLALAREGCPRVPAPTAWLARGAGRGVVRRSACSSRSCRAPSDGWELALRELAKGEDFGAEARALGRATAEVHTALARALPTVTLGHTQLQTAGRRHDRAPGGGRAGGARAAAVRARAALRVHGAGRPGRGRAVPGPRSASTATCTSGSACARRPGSGR